MAVPKTGGSPAIIASEPGTAPDYVVSDGTNAYFIIADRLLAAPIAGLPLLCQRGADTNQCALRRNGGRWHAGQRGSHAIKARAIARRTVASESAK
ncbi:hypothetical protein [Sorangium sp. So ce124]|uniref:hypothetical protein n=1 Tax=Sorangium sp. So ce124 TaxID=3133280 RepID=UPI003F5E6A3B